MIKKKRAKRSKKRVNVTVKCTSTSGFSFEDRKTNLTEYQSRVFLKKVNDIKKSCLERIYGRKLRKEDYAPELSLKVTIEEWTPNS